MSNQPPADRSQLWTAPVDTSAEAAAKAAALQGEAQRYAAGAEFAKEEDRDFYKKQAENAKFMAQQQEGAAFYQRTQYEGARYATQQHNEPIEAALKAAEEQRTQQILADTGKFIAGAAVATMAVGAAAELSPGMAAIAAGNIFAPGLAPAVAMAMGPKSMFDGLGATPQKLGIKPALDEQLGPVMPGVAIDNVAKASPAVAEEMAVTPTTSDTPVRVAPRPINNEFHNNTFANGPKRPTWAAEKPIGGSPGT